MVGEIIQDAAETIGLFTFQEKITGKEPLACPIGENTYIIKVPSSSTPLCDGLTVTVAAIESIKIMNHDKKANKTLSGIFYRQTIPYKITITDGIIKKEKIVFSPSGSRTLFLPIAKTFFSDNKSDFGFTDGMPTKYMQDTDSEIAALMKIPAGVIEAYFKAVGGIFTNLQKKDQGEAAALTESLKLELVKKKIDQCIAAINQGRDDLIKELGCGS